jgi:hypothetical protein
MVMNEPPAQPPNHPQLKNRNQNCTCHSEQHALNTDAHEHSQGRREHRAQQHKKRKKKEKKKKRSHPRPINLQEGRQTKTAGVHVTGVVGDGILALSGRGGPDLNLAVGRGLHWLVQKTAQPSVRVRDIGTAHHAGANAARQGHTGDTCNTQWKNVGDT